MDYLSLIYYFDKFYVYVDYSLFYQLMIDHPQAGTTFSFVDTLNKFDVKNWVLKIKFEQLEDNPFPLIGFLKSNNELTKLIIILKIKNNKVYYITDHKTISERKETFKSKWEGSAIYIEPNEKDNKFKLRYTKKILLTALGVIFLFSSLIFASFPINLMIILCLSGLMVSISLKNHEEGITDIITSLVCKKNNIVDCDKVLDSKASMLFNTKMSNIGIAFFVINICILFLSFITNNYNFLILSGISNVLSLPYVFFSISYQLFFIKKICTLCLTTMLILSVLATVSFLYVYFNKLIFNFFDVFLMVSIATLVFVGLRHYMISMDVKKTQHKESDTFFAFKRDADTFNKILKSQNDFLLTQNYSSFSIGKNKEASSIVSIILSFNCNACANIFKELITYIDQEDSCINVNLYFVGLDDDKNDIPRKVLAHFIYVYINLTSNEFKRDVLDWYENGHNKDSEIYKKIISIEIDSSVQNFIEKYMIKDFNNIDYTPAFIIGNKIVPKYYDLAGIKYYLNYNYKNKTI